MIITRTPFRISFVGGGSDISSFYERHDGAVLSTTINKYMYVTIHPSFSRGETVLKYSMTESVRDVRQLRHPIARQLLLDHGIEGCEIVSTADVPSGTGLSTSSAYTVGLIHSLYAYQGKYCSQERIAAEACSVEIEELGEPIGKQDQYGTAIGGLKVIRFLRDGSVEVEPVVVSRQVLGKLNQNLLLFYTGLTHSAGEILEEQNRSVASEEDKFNSLIKMTALVYDMRDALSSGKLDDFGAILDENWKLKRSLTNAISNDFIDKYYKIAMENGALGGKLLGAGGGGFLLFYCPEERQLRLKAALSDLTLLPFDMENSGTKVVYVGNKDWA
ncbi:MAG: GHMP kinase [Treponema sp.]|nr:GHMP kinase [Treponema sp.]